jgi:biotin carboxyl carrier protein
MANIKLMAPATGTVWKIEKSVGDRVEEGESVLILESMKMEIPLESTAAGVIVEFTVEENASVEEDQVLCVIES